ncbi:MAG: S-adenosyl-l-methionine hydroxide adenosyltransferase family protein [Bryobacteraceae bacterium]
MKPFHPGPLITLTTDFGLADHYVGTMKGVLLSRCPGVQLVDISHEIPPFSIYSGAYTIDQAAPYFPSGTIHVIVVDPGVGTARKPLLVEALGQSFIAPDNGVLSMILKRDTEAKVREITNRELWTSSPSSTFHGRDIFAPVAAALASGTVKPDKAGPILAKLELLPDLDVLEIKPGQWQGKLLSVDRFGNAITNFCSGAFAKLATSRFRLAVGNHRITTFQSTFGEAPDGLCFAYFGSSGYIELAVKEQSAAHLLNAAPGDSIILRLLDLHK